MKNVKNLVRFLTIWLLVFPCISVGKFSSKKDVLDFFKLYGTKETAQKMVSIITEKKKGVYFRFGDGDVNLATHWADMLQPPSEPLRIEMREAFAIQGDTVLKALPVHCKDLESSEPGMAPGLFAADLPWCLNLLNKALPVWNIAVRDIYSAYMLAYFSSEDQDTLIWFLSFLKKNNTCLLVGNKNIPVFVRTVLFGSQCDFVPTPPAQSYREIDRIERECLEKIANQGPEYKVVVISMGCSGRVLAKRLWGKLDNVFLFDFGSLMDALCGWQTRSWIEYAPKLDGKKLLARLAEVL